MTTEVTTKNQELVEKLSGLRRVKTAKELLHDLKTIEKADKLLLVLLDCSDSMADRIESMRKIDVAWKTFQEELMPNMSGWTYGVILFQGWDVRWEVMPTTNTKALSNIVSAPIPRGSTPMGKALQFAWSWARSNAKQARFILLTDGQGNDMPKEAILEMARANLSIPIDTVGIGSGLFDYDPEFLKTLSSITGGMFVEVNTVKLLSDTIKKLSPSERPLLGTVEKI